VTDPSVAVRRSPLDAVHRRLGARMVPFGGWEMPLSYPSGTVAEHLACRHDAVVFDVSHLGTVRVTGPGARHQLQSTLTNDLGRIAPGRAQYTHLLDEHDASVVDDIIVWWVDDERFDVMPNASNTTGVLGALGGQDVTDTRAVLAVQGPDARRRLATVAPEAAAVRRFGVGSFSWHGVGAVAAGTGYTGEDGVELAVPVAIADELWTAITSAGIVPAGLGARDTLRLEAALPLHGHELGPGITPLQAGLGWVVSWTKPEGFRGREALEKERAAGVSRHLIGLVGEGRRPPRADAALTIDGAVVGRVTSGNFSPVLGHGIALALVDGDVAGGDDHTGGQRRDHHQHYEIELPGRPLTATRQQLPFVAKKKG
jgi:aminomethyltransferase